jgi:hypothetical protein
VVRAWCLQLGLGGRQLALELLLAPAPRARLAEIELELRELLLLQLELCLRDGQSPLQVEAARLRRVLCRAGIARIRPRTARLRAARGSGGHLLDQLLPRTLRRRQLRRTLRQLRLKLAAPLPHRVRLRP